MRRREFVRLLGGAAGAWPFRLSAQQSSMPLIGFLSSRSPEESTGLVAAFHQGLRETGLVEGQDFGVVFRWAQGRYDRLPTLAAELLGLRVALLFAAGGPPAAFAAKASTSAIPIVFSAVSDPVEIGLVRSLNQPGANVTGMAVFNAALAAKRIELTKELMPAIGLIGYLLNGSDRMSEIESERVLAAARALGIELRVFNASSEQELDTAFAAVAKLHAGAFVISGEPFFDSQRERIVALSARERVAGVYAWREYVLAGGLMSYGTDLPDSYRRAAIYAGRILKGEKPADLPVAQATKFQLAINLKTARMLSIKVPPTLLARADEVIE